MGYNRRAPFFCKMPDQPPSASPRAGLAGDPVETGLVERRSATLLRDVLVNYSGFLVTGVVGMLIVPFLLRHIGTEAFGVWICATALAGMLAAIDPGLYPAIVRAVAAEGSSSGAADASGLVNSAAVSYAALGLAGAAVLAGAAPFALPRLNIRTTTPADAGLIFVLVGAAFLAERMLFFADAVLSGLRRFATLSAISVAGALLRAGGYVLLLGSGRGVVAVVTWSAIISLSSAVTALAAMRFGQRPVRCRLRFEWELFRPHLPFAGQTFAATLSMRTIWDLSPTVLGWLRGAAAVVPLSLGQRFPFAVGRLNYTASAAFLPAASAGDAVTGMAEVVLLGTRWVMTVALPLCVVLWVLAPNLVSVWLGSAAPEVVTILRLSTGAILVDALGIAASQSLWGGGKAGTVLWVYGAMVGPSVILTVVLSRWYGARGSAAGLLLCLLVCALAFVGLASREARIPRWRVFRTGVLELAPATACAAALAWALRSRFALQDWSAVLATAAGCGLVYLAVFLSTTGKREVRLLAGLLGRRLRSVPAEPAHPEDDLAAYFVHPMPIAEESTGAKGTSEA